MIVMIMTQKEIPFNMGTKEALKVVNSWHKNFNKFFTRSVFFSFSKRYLGLASAMAALYERDRKSSTLGL